MPTATTHCVREQTNFQSKKKPGRTLKVDRICIAEINKLHHEACPNLESRREEKRGRPRRACVKRINSIWKQLEMIAPDKFDGESWWPAYASLWGVTSVSKVSDFNTNHQIPETFGNKSMEKCPVTSIHAITPSKCTTYNHHNKIH